MDWQNRAIDKWLDGLWAPLKEAAGSKANESETSGGAAVEKASRGECAVL